MLHGKLSTPGEYLAKMTQFYLEYKLVVYFLVAARALLDIWHLALAGPRTLASSWHACADHTLSGSGSGVLTARWSGCNWSLSHLVTVSVSRVTYLRPGLRPASRGQQTGQSPVGGSRVKFSAKMTHSSIIILQKYANNSNIIGKEQ